MAAEIALSMAAEMTYIPSSSSSQWKYDVFLSFRGLDTRINFIDFLFNKLAHYGIRTFRDSEELINISSGLMEAIEGSRVAIIVFSENYASSPWCLTELTKILDCKKDGRMEKVLPIFYNVDPSDVRKQTNKYAKAFKRHEEHFKDEMGKVEKWRIALTEAANFSGWDLTNVPNRHEAKFVNKIAEQVLRIVNKTHLHVADHPIGMDFHIKQIGCLLNGIRLDHVGIIGIYGPGGIGKTTIAKAVFSDMIRNFEGGSFLANVREVSRQPNGLALLQKRLLLDVMNMKEMNNDDVGIYMIKEHLRYRRVFIVLDDVGEMGNFYEVVGWHGSLGAGSRIILTTRDEQLLNMLGVDEKYKVHAMNQNEALQLFSHHAFQQSHPLEDYVHLSNEVIDYAKGLPLALVVLGSLLCNRSQVECEIELKRIRKIPNDRIFQKLVISYNALDDFNRAIFLDISCFFIGKHKNFVITILDACGLGGEAGIKLLTKRSLITIDDENMLGMHDLIRDMGREIVRTESPSRPGGRSRLWDNDDTIDVLGNFTGTDAVEGIQLDLCQYNGKKFSLSTVEGFSQMPNLRLLEVNSYKNGGNFDEAHSLQSWVRCFQNLVWISWEGFPFEYIPDNFDLGNIVIVNMQGSKLKEVWKGTKYLTKLKELNLSFSLYLVHMPDFSGFPNLEKLILRGCEKLVEVHESIDHLKKLVILNLKHCSNLRNLPSDISKLALLETLDISFCQRLELLPMLPSSLCSFKAQGCSRLKMLPNLSNLKHLTILLLSNCSQLTEIQGLEDLKSATNIDLLGCDNLKSSFKERIFQDLCRDLGNHNNICDIILDENEIPDWFGFQRQSDNADSLSCQLTTFGTGGMIICVCLDISMETGYLGAILETVVVVLNKTKNFTWRHEIKFQYYMTQTWVIMIPHCVWKSIAEEGDNINVSVEETSGKFVLKKIGVHSSYALSMAAEMTYGPSSSSRTWTYDVFLSFCGQDTRTIFIDFLFNELIRNRIHTFRDSEEVNRGENVSSKLIEAINGSRIAIIVFSENYASSTWCLSELVTILDCKKDGRIEKVLPVFYKVDLSDVRKQTNTYAEAFMRHEKRFKYEMGKVKSWRAALAEAASMPGLYLEKVPTGDHSILIKLIVQEVLREVSISPLDECYDDKVFAKLKISYDKLSDDSKTIFLDIACHFTGWIVEEAIPIWEACELCPRLAIKELTQKHLLKIENDVSFRMHGQLQYMGKRIASKNSHGDPTNHTRLWSRDEISKILKKDTGTKMVEGLLFDCTFKFDGEDNLSYEDFANMPNLRFLNVYPIDKLNGDFSDLPSKLRWFSWHHCPLTILPPNFYHEELVHLELSWSRIKLAWNDEPQNENKRFRKLKVLILTSSQDLSISSNFFSWFPCLQRLDLMSCSSLLELPDSICQIVSLRSLILSSCVSFNKLPMSIGDLKHLVKLYVNRTDIEELPEGLGQLEKLEELDVSNCPKLVRLPTSMVRMRSLLHFDMSDTMIVKVPDDFSKLSSLEVLRMGMVKPNDELDYKRLQPLLISISGFPSQLQGLYLEGYNNLESLPELPSALTHLEVKKCISLQIISDLSHLERLKELLLYDCESLVRLPDLSNLKRLKKFCIINCTNLEAVQGLEGTESLEELVLKGFPKLKVLPDFSNLKILRNFFISNCENLEEVHGFKETESLEELKVKGCPKLIELSDLSNLKRLRKLCISNCEILEGVHGLQETVSLEELEVKGCLKLTEVPDLSNLKRLRKISISNCENLEEVHGLKGTEFLEELEVKGCPKLTELPDLSNLNRLKKFCLSSLEVLNMGKRLDPLPISKSGFPSQLQELHLAGYMNLESLPELPCTLTRLEVEQSDFSLCLNLKTSKVKSKKGFSLQQMLRQQPNIDVQGFPSDIEEAEKPTRTLNFFGSSFGGVRGADNVTEEVVKAVWYRFFNCFSARFFVMRHYSLLLVLFFSFIALVLFCVWRFYSSGDMLLLPPPT